MEARLLAVENDVEFFERHNIEWIKHGITPVRVTSMYEAIDTLAKDKYDEFVIIGINADNVQYLPMLPLLREFTALPIHIMTSNYLIEDELKALECGASHYGRWIENPSDSTMRAVCMLRKYKELLRRPPKSRKYNLYKDIFIFPPQRRVYVGGTEIDLTAHEFDLLNLFVTYPKRVYTAEYLLKSVWGDENIVEGRNILWSAIKRLRKKINTDSDDQGYIQNIRDIGYAFDK